MKKTILTALTLAALANSLSAQTFFLNNASLGNPTEAEFQAGFTRTNVNGITGLTVSVNTSGDFDGAPTDENPGVANNFFRNQIPGTGVNVYNFSFSTATGSGIAVTSARITSTNPLTYNDVGGAGDTNESVVLSGVDGLWGSVTTGTFVNSTASGLTTLNLTRDQSGGFLSGTNPTFDATFSGANITNVSYEYTQDDPDRTSGGITQPFSLEITVVPEPSSTALLGLGGLALILRRKK